MNFSKSTNQYYASYIESRVDFLVNHKQEFAIPLDYTFSLDEINELNRDAYQISQLFQNVQHFEYTGRHCAQAVADFIVDGQTVELKYVSNGTGTYLNTSIKYLEDKLGFTPFNYYMQQELLPTLRQLFPEKVCDNISPVSIADSKDIRHNYPEQYKIIKAIDKNMRKQLVDDLYNFLLNNPDKLFIFVSDMIDKNISDTKQAPDRMIIFNHLTKEIQELSQQDIKRYKHFTLFSKTDLGLKFDEFRIQIGWQNGNGLNNPTLRVFLK